MCGIWCAITAADKPVDPPPSVLNRISARGPDGTSTVKLQVAPCDGATKDGNPTTTPTTLSLSFSAAVLALRGPAVVQQPVVHPALSSGTAAPPDSFVFCWNGEGWKYGDQVLDTGVNDTEFVFAKLREAVLGARARALSDAKDRSCLAERTRAAVFGELDRVQGPYAFLFYEPLSKSLFFGRDCLGRRSLLFRKSDDGFVISSVSPEEDHRGDISSEGWTEVNADGIYVLSLGRNLRSEIDERCHFSTSRAGTVSVFKYASPNGDGSSCPHPVPRFPAFNTALPTVHSPLSVSSKPVIELEQVLRRSISHRLPSIPPQPAAEDLDNSPKRCRLAILFSGGLDCSVLARLCHDLYPPDEPIDLLNVAFKNPRLVKNTSSSTENPDRQADTDPYSLCPDRATGLEGYRELQTTCPGREWNFVSINVPYSQYCRHRPTIVSLIRPHDTEMDLSIAAALYFASRGRGAKPATQTVGSSPRTPPDEGGGGYTCPARVLLSGLGADELFGGYRRHEIAFDRGGYPALIGELGLDFSRLGHRNLGRDDRVTAHWAREVRYPFLDEDVVAWALSQSVADKCPFGEGPIPTGPPPERGDGAETETETEPGKKVLRLVALNLGLVHRAREKKRAIQFGARTAKMEPSTGKVKGTAKIL